MRKFLFVHVSADLCTVTFGIIKETSSGTISSNHSTILTTVEILIKRNFKDKGFVHDETVDLNIKL